MTVHLDFGDDGIATVTLARPETRDELIAAFTAVRDAPHARVLLLRAEGKHFSAGADLSEFGNAANVFEARRIRWDRDPWMHLWHLPQPTLAALHGYALGAGLEMALLCDLRLAAAGTRLGLPETTLGMLPAAAGTQSLGRILGAPAATAHVMLGETIDADEAARRGIVHRVVNTDALDSEALAAAQQLSALDPEVARSAKRALRIAADLSLADGLAAERRLARVGASRQP
ncbi:MAG: enoyl-CoA hydratase/isomerase family protein [Acidimicrobiales bacterium]|nr:enoyl-CoA hydratase/isomerase family protein [Acidimicrobiales bacterium]